MNCILLLHAIVNKEHTYIVIIIIIIIIIIRMIMIIIIIIIMIIILSFDIAPFPYKHAQWRITFHCQRIDVDIYIVI